MSAFDTTTGRRGITATVIAASIAALVMIPLAAQAASAATPKCFGQKATIVGTRGDDVIKGTPRADVIVARGGNDVISGGGGKDRICGGGGADRIGGGVGADWINGGWGNDTLVGYKGDDKILGMQGHDTLRGSYGNDRLNGGDGTDRCVQNEGTGAIRNCETADLAVAVSGPKNVKGGEVTFTVTVTNHGPDAVVYTLNLAQSSQKATCSAPDWAGDHAGAVLPVGATRDVQVVATCGKDANGAKVILDATVSSLAPDPDDLNNAGQGRTNLR